jgi:hypothetical protein
MSDLYDTGFGGIASGAARAVAACLALGLAGLGAGCTYPDTNVPYCEQAFLGGCLKNDAVPAAAVPRASPPVASPPVASPPVASPPVASPPVASPAAVAPAVVSPPPAVAPAPVSVGNPSAFADEDDKQCRSYGLTFGSRDYADCRIRLSAQHRGLDPNIGTTPGAGSR